MNGRELNRRVVESLIRAGAFDSLGYKRRALLQVTEKVLDGVAAEGRKNVAGQMGLFDMYDEEEAAAPALVLPEVEEFSAQEMMTMEREVTGLFLSGHPMDQYREPVRRIGAVPIGAIMSDFAAENGPTRFHDGQSVIIAGVIGSSRTRTTKNNTLMAYIELEDDTGSMELLAFQRALDTGGKYLAVNNIVVVRGRISLRDEKEPQLMADSIRPITEAEVITDNVKDEAPKKPDGPGETTVYVRLPGRDCPAMRRVELVHSMFPGEDRLVLYFTDTGRRLGAKCLAHEAFISELQELAGKENVVVKVK